MLQKKPEQFQKTIVQSLMHFYLISPLQDLSDCHSGYSEKPDSIM